VGLMSLYRNGEINMVVTEKLLLFFIDLILPICVGYLLQKQKRWGDPFFNKMMRVGIIYVTSITVTISFWGSGISAETIWLPILGVVMQMVPFGIGYYVAKRKYKDPLEQGSYILAAMLLNRGVVGSLSVYILFGEVGYSSAQLVMLLSNLVLFSFCFPMANYFSELEQGKRRGKPKLKSVLISPTQLPTLGIVFGIILYFSGINRPRALANVMDITIHITAWLGLIPVGYSINFKKMKGYWKRIWDIAAIKFVLTPVLLYFPARLLIHNDIVLRTFLVLATAPTAINAVATAKLNKLNVHVAMAAFILTTALYVVVIFPLLLLLNSL
jgi:predicted permease